MDCSPRAYILKASGKRRPTVWLASMKPGYFGNLFNGSTLLESWRPPIREIRGLSYTPSDAILWTGPGILISRRAVELFQSVAPDCAEYPFFTEIKSRPYFAVYVRFGTDALDMQNARVNRSATGRIVSIRRHAFKPGLELPPLFKLDDLLDCDLYCSSTLAEAIVESKLTGFSFWDPAREHLADLFRGKDPNCVSGVVA